MVKRGRKVKSEKLGENSDAVDDRRKSTRKRAKPTVSSIEDKEPPSTVKVEKVKELKIENVKEEFEDGNSDQEYSDEEFDSSKYELSDYELLRKENMQKNFEIFEQFNVNEAKHELKEATKKKKKPSLEVSGLRPYKKRIVIEDQPRRVSLRLQKIQADLALLPKELPRVTTYSYHNYDERKPSEIKMENEEDTSLKGVIESFVELSEKSSNLIKEPTTKDLQEYKKRLSLLEVKYIGKITANRVCSLAVHPMEDKTIAFVGGKHGDIGIWDVGSDAKNNGILHFEPHSAPIMSLKLLPTDSTKIFSCSYDGTIRCGDLKKQQFNQVFGFDEDIDARFHYFDWPCNDSNSVYSVTSNGNLILVDIRSGKCENEYNIYRRSSRCIDFHPLNENLLATTCIDGTVSTWDRRNLSQKSKDLSYFKAGKISTTGFFSPRTGHKLLLTSQDDHLRVLDVDSKGKFILPPTHQIKHDNYVTRWLTTFRAAWDPKENFCFVSGSMARPRQIDIYGIGNDEKLCYFPMRDEEFTTVTSVNAFHPKKDVIVGGNSTGKVFVWS